MPVKLPAEDIVQCVSARRGHQILYKGYTYVFKARLQCGAEQWCCSSRQKTGCISLINMQSTGVRVIRDFHNHKKPALEDLNQYNAPEEGIPEWVLIYYVKKTDTEFTCSLCHSIVLMTENSKALLEHLVNMHKEIHDLHKENPQGNVGFHIEYLELNVGEDGDTKCQPVMLGQICDATTEEITQTDKSYIKEVVVKSKKKKAANTLVLGTPESELSNRKRSWVWKYFHRMSNIIFRCTLCNVVLSIKGCNTNNMNRHVRSRHPTIYTMELQNKSGDADLDISEMDTTVSVKTEEISAGDKDADDSLDQSSRQRRSWIWLYFDRTSATSAQCKLCRRHISHGGNATGNMNRHLKMIHHKTATDYSWIWKVFDCSEENVYTCKICQYRCTRHPDNEKSVTAILNHLKDEHAVVSGDQIITGTDDGEEA